MSDEVLCLMLLHDNNKAIPSPMIRLNIKVNELYEWMHEIVYMSMVIKINLKFLGNVLHIVICLIVREGVNSMLSIR